MENENKKSEEAVLLRQKAEEKLKQKDPLDKASLTNYETLKLLHEFQVHEIELEMKNEELLLARKKAEEATQKFRDLYDFAPSGYLTLDKECKIVQLNLTASSMLEKERSYLVNSDFKLSLTQDTLPELNDFFQKVFKTDSKEICTVQLKGKNNNSIFVHLDGKVDADRQKCLITAVDITEQKQAQKKIEKKMNELETINNHMVGRELKMIELKYEINKLLKQLGETEKY